MGYRTVAIFNNDVMHNMKEDPTVGDRIYHAAGTFNYPVDYQKLDFHYGRIISHAHMDATEVIVFNRNQEGFSLNYNGQNDKFLNEGALFQMKDCLERNGYRVTKKRK